MKQTNLLTGFYGSVNRKIFKSARPYFLEMLPAIPVSMIRLWETKPAQIGAVFTLSFKLDFIDGLAEIF